MRKVFIVCASFLISYVSIAQQPTGQNRPAGGGRPSLTGTMYGKLIEAKSSKPIEYASVQLLQKKFDTATKSQKEVVIAGMLSRANGEFTLENVPAFGEFTLQVSVVGFKPFEQMVSFGLKPGEMNAAALDKDLGNIKVDIAETVLDNVTITAEKPGLQLGIDRKVFNVDKNIVSAGGTAVDIMRNVPSINVDIDGNVSLRNNAPQIFVDGRPTTMTLEQIPADAIESVEIITNPSAKFDASGGTAGILNIVLKKNRKVGYNGSLRTNIDSRGRIGLGGDINVRQNKINVFLNANYNQRRSKSTGTTERTTKGFFPDYYQFQEDNSVFDGNFKFIRTGIDYFITNRTTLSGSVNIANGKFESYNRNLYRTDFDVTPDSSTLTQRTSDATREFKNFGASLNFKHNFPKAGREWTADVNYRGRSGPSDNLLTNTLYNPDFITINEQLLQRQIGDGQSKSIIIQSDFVNPLSENSKMELGVRAAFNNNKNNNAYYDLDPATRNIILPATSVQDYESNDRVLAAYATFSNRIGNFGYQLGLRTESSNYQGEMKLTSEKFNIDYAISLFPSVFLSQKLKNDQELQLNYSRRINRPNFWQLTPVIDSSDALNPSVGNPGLKPEFTNSLEMSYQKIFKNKDNFLASVYYKNTNDLITNFQETWIDPVSGKRQFLSTYINANSSFVTGLELTMRNNIAKWWELTTNFNLFTSKIKVDHPEFAQQDPFASWFGKINNSFKVTKKLTFQLSGSYQSRTVLPPGGGGGGRGGGGGMFGQSSSAQGYIKPVYFVDAAVRYTFLKENRGTLSLNMNDVLRTRVSDIHTESPTQIYDAFRRRDPQILRLTFSWRFGKFDTSLFKRKTNKPSDDGNDGGMNMGL